MKALPAQLFDGDDGTADSVQLKVNEEFARRLQVGVILAVAAVHVPDRIARPAWHSSF